MWVVYVKIQSSIFLLIFGQKKGLSLSQLTKNRKKSGYRSRRRCGITKVWTWANYPTMKLVNGLQFLKSLFCWAQVMNLTTEQCRIIEGSGIGSEFPIEFLWFATNAVLCGTNTDHVRMSHNKCKTVDLLHEHVTGSVEQFPSVEMDGLDIDFAWNGMSECFVKKTWLQRVYMIWMEESQWPAVLWHMELRRRLLLEDSDNAVMI